MEILKNHTLNLSNDNMTINGVTEVLTFENNLIVLSLGDRVLTIKGENLKINELDVKGGRLTAMGEVIGLMYSKSREKLSFFKKLFR